LTTLQDPAKKRALGRGLDALLPALRPVVAVTGDKSIFVCALEKIVPRKGQPRTHFDPVALEELAQSIREHGLLEPLLVRRAGMDRFEIVAGERRWRACQKAGLREALVLVKDLGDDDAFEVALVENLQREDLGPVELAEGLERLVKDRGYTQEALANRLGKDRTTITNALRLLKLPVRVRARLAAGELTEGHARALLGLESDSSMSELAEKVIKGHLSVRATEGLVRESKRKKPGAKDGAAPEKSASVRDLEARLSRALGVRVIVRDSGNKGEIAIPYANLDVLDRLIDKLL
jgi:ParB family transcriptional regulator, chromosome partitioning protein